jgi:hypothetical protein
MSRCYWFYKGSGSGRSYGRGGDIGSYNTSKTTRSNSNNDNNTRQRVDGRFLCISNEHITRSENLIISISPITGDNYSGAHNPQDSNSPPTEEELLERIQAAREKLAAKKELERLKKLEEELEQLEAELVQDE